MRPRRLSCALRGSAYGRAPQGEVRVERGLRKRAPPSSASVISAGAMASQRLTAATAAVAAQPIEENASANVAIREETWRRRNWLRLAWVRNQSWIAVAQVAAITMP